MADVITGEAVALELPVANFPSRIAALLIDMLVQVALLLVVDRGGGASGRLTATDYARPSCWRSTSWCSSRTRRRSRP